jgi:hypothetical protein
VMERRVVDGNLLMCVEAARWAGRVPIKTRPSTLMSGIVPVFWACSGHRVFVAKD